MSLLYFLSHPSKTPRTNHGSINNDTHNRARSSLYDFTFAPCEVARRFADLVVVGISSVCEAHCKISSKLVEYFDCILYRAYLLATMSRSTASWNDCFIS